jgi:hypothetical protein
MQALAAAKGPVEFIELQQKLIKGGGEAAVGDSQRIAQLTTAVFTAAFEPVKKQIEAVQKTAQTRHQERISPKVSKPVPIPLDVDQRPGSGTMPIGVMERRPPGAGVDNVASPDEFLRIVARGEKEDPHRAGGRRCGQC